MALVLQTDVINHPNNITERRRPKTTNKYKNYLKNYKMTTEDIKNKVLCPFRWMEKMENGKTTDGCVREMF